MHKITIPCPGCGSDVDFNSRFFGQLVECPKCSHLLDVPDPTAHDSGDSSPSVGTATLTRESKKSATRLPSTKKVDNVREVRREVESRLHRIEKMLEIAFLSILVVICVAGISLALLLNVFARARSVADRPVAPSAPKTSLDAAIPAPPSGPNLVVGTQEPTTGPRPTRPEGTPPEIRAAAQLVQQTATQVAFPYIQLSVPELPPRPEFHTLEEDVDWAEVRFAPTGERVPGDQGRLWIYVPRGKAAPASLSCVITTSSGGSLFTGVPLQDSSRNEHLAFARAGFVVVAFEQDGAVADHRRLQRSGATLEAFRQYMASQAGLLNARAALEWVLARMPEVDPDRIYAAGFDSAANAALLWAAHEPRLAGTIALSPLGELQTVYDRHYDWLVSTNEAVPGFREFLLRSCPRAHLDRIQAPVFLFQAMDDKEVAAEQTLALALQLQRLRKPQTLFTVPAGDHRDALQSTGIPKAIAWVRELESRSSPGKL